MIATNSVVIPDPEVDILPTKPCPAYVIALFSPKTLSQILSSIVTPSYLNCDSLWFYFKYEKLSYNYFLL